MHDAAGAEKQQCLKVCVRKKVKNAGAVCTYAACEKHVAELAHGGISDDALYIILNQGDGGGKQACSCSGNSNNSHCDGRQTEYRVEARHHKNTGSNHGSRMYQGTHRCRALHRIRQPHMKRYLGGFSDRTAEQKQRNKSYKVDIISQEG